MPTDSGIRLEVAPIRIPSRREIIEAARSKGLKIAAVMPYHYPRALLRAHGIHPVEVWGPPGCSTVEGDRHFQAYTCAIVRNAATLLLAKEADHIDLALIPHNCDSLQGMGSVLRDFVQTRFPVLTFYLPRTQRDGALEYLEAEVRRLSADLARHTGTQPSEAALREAVALESRADQAFADLCLHRDKFGLDDRAFYQVLRSREYLSPEQFLSLLREVPSRESPAKGVGLLLSGIVPEPMELFDRLNAMGARVVADDLACGSRRVYRNGSNGDNPHTAMARALLTIPPDPITGAPIEERIAHLLQRLRESGAKGVLVYDVKFCEPELFGLPLLRKALSEAGFPFLHIEHELGSSLTGQVVTRLEAFIEMLR